MPMVIIAEFDDGDCFDRLIVVNPVIWVVSRVRSENNALPLIHPYCKTAFVVGTERMWVVGYWRNVGQNCRGRKLVQGEENLICSRGGFLCAPLGQFIVIVGEHFVHGI